MKYILIVAALLTAIVAALGETTHVIDGRKFPTGVGFAVIGMALVSTYGALSSSMRLIGQELSSAISVSMRSWKRIKAPV